MSDIAQRRVPAHERLDLRRCPIVTRIVDHDQLSKHQLRHCGEGLLDQSADIALLVERRDDDGKAHGEPWGLAEAWGQQCRLFLPRK